MSTVVRLDLATLAEVYCIKMSNKFPFFFFFYCFELNFFYISMFEWGKEFVINVLSLITAEMDSNHNITYNHNISPKIVWPSSCHRLLGENPPGIQRNVYSSRNTIKM